MLGQSGDDALNIEDWQCHRRHRRHGARQRDEGRRAGAHPDGIGEARVGVLVSVQGCGRNWGLTEVCTNMSRGVSRLHPVDDGLLGVQFVPQDGEANLRLFALVGKCLFQVGNLGKEFSNLLLRGDRCRASGQPAAIAACSGSVAVASLHSCRADARCTPRGSQGRELLVVVHLLLQGSKVDEILHSSWPCVGQ